MATVRCRNCDAENDYIESAGHCHVCGKALPRPDAYGAAPPPGPRGGFYDPYAPAGPDVTRPDGVSPEMKQARQHAAGALFAVAVLQLVCGGIALALAPQVLGAPLTPEEMAVQIGLMVGVAVVFGCLGAWAMYSPLAPAVIGLVLYLLLLIADVVFMLNADPSLVGRGLVIRIIIVAMLVRAVAAAAKAR
jgi:hypothetical protein